MARRINGSYPNPIEVAVDLRTLAKARRLDAGTDPRDVVSFWLESYPGAATYVEDEAVVGEAEMLGSSFVQGYGFADESLAAAFRGAFDGHLLPPALWAAYKARSRESAPACP